MFRGLQVYLNRASHSDFQLAEIRGGVVRVRLIVGYCPLSVVERSARFVPLRSNGPCIRFDIQHPSLHGRRAHKEDARKLKVRFHRQITRLVSEDPYQNDREHLRVQSTQSIIPNEQKK